MVNGNNQVNLKLAKAKDGSQGTMPLETLLWSRIVFPSDVNNEFTLTADSDFIALNNVGVDSILYVDGSSNVNGQLDGGVVAAKYVDPEVDPLIMVIGNVHANVMPLLDTDHNEILKENGDGIYVAITTTYDDGVTLAGSELRANFFSYDSNGLPVSEFLKPEVPYTFNLNKVYAWANARAKELDTSKAIGSPLNETSREEVVKLMSSLAKITSDFSVKVKIEQDSNTTIDESWTLDFVTTQTEDGYFMSTNLTPSSSQSSALSSTYIDNSVNGVAAIERLDKIVNDVIPELQGIHVYFNGIKIPLDLITISDGVITIDNSTNEIGTGKIYNGDVFTIEFEDEI